MAIKATFVANFQALEQAVNKAAINIRTFEKEGRGAAASLSRMAESFSGARIQAEALKVTRAVEAIGGASKLTEAEQRRVNQTLTEAIAKYRALGQEAPASLQKLAQETSRSEGLLSKLAGSGGAAQAVLAGGVAGAVAAVGTAALSAATNVARLAVQGVGELVKRGAEIAPLREGFVRLSGGVSEADKALAAMRTATKGLIIDTDLYAGANKAMLLGVSRSGEEIGKLAQTATVLGRAMGQDAKKSFDDLITALGRSSPMILDNLGLSVSVAKANEEYAQALGKTAEQLTDAEKKQAFMTAALKAAEERVRELGGVTLTFGDRLQIIRNQFTNFTDALAVGISQSPVLNAALEAVGGAMTDAFGANQADLVQTIIKVVDKLAMGIVSAADLLVSFAQRGAEAVGALVAVVLTQTVAVIRTAKTFNDTLVKLAEMAAYLPGATGAAFAKMADEGRAAGRSLEEMKTTVAGLRDEAIRTANGQGKLNEVLGKAQGFIADMRKRMEEASKTIVSQTTVTKALADRTREAGEAAKQKGEKVKGLVANLTEAVSKAQAYARDIERLGGVTRLTRDQQAEANKVLAAGVEALRALGQEGTPTYETIKRLRDATFNLVEPLRQAKDGTTMLAQAMEKLRTPAELFAESWQAFVLQVKSGGEVLEKIWSDIPKISGPVDLWKRHIQEAKGKTDDWSKSLADLSQALANLADTGGGLGGFARIAASAVQMANVALQSFGKVSEGLKVLAKQAEGSMVQAFMNVATGIVSGIGMMANATAPGKSLGERLIGGAMSGAMTGASAAALGATIAGATAKGMAVAGVWGAAAGAIVGFFVGYFRGRATRREMEIVGKEWGVSISKGLYDQIKAAQDDLFHGDRVAASIFKMSDIIQEAGGLNKLNFDEFLAKFRDIFVMLDEGKFTTQQALHVIAENFDQFAKIVVESGRLASRKFLEILELNARSGVFAPEILQFVEGRLGEMSQGLAGMLAPVAESAQRIGDAVREAQAKVDELTEKGKTKTQEYAEAVSNLAMLQAQQRAEAEAAAGDLENIGTIALAAFNKARESGLTFVEAINAIGPSLDAILQTQQNLGITSENVAVQQLVRYRELVNAHGPLVQAAGALNQTMLALSHIGGLNAESLAAMEDQGMRTFTRLIDAGFTEQEALAQISDWLITVMDAHKDLGIPIDDNTRKLIEQADQYGLLQRDGKSMTEILKGGFDSVVDAINTLIERLGTGVEGAANRAAGAINRIPRKVPIDVEVNYPNGRPPSGSRRSEDEGDEPGFATGTGGAYWNFGSGTRAWLHGYEKIVPLGEEDGGGGRGVTVNVDARGALLGDYASQQQLARIIEEAITAALEQRGTLPAIVGR